MGLTSGLFLALVVAAAVVLPLLTVALWNRMRGPVPLRVAGRLSLISLCQAAAVLLAALMINNSFQLYASWADLLGNDGSVGSISAADPVRTTSTVGAVAPERGYPNTRLFHGVSRINNGFLATITGPVSKITAMVYVRVPPQYYEPRYAHVLFPVVQLLSGYPGTPGTWLGGAMDAPRILDGLVSQGTSHPFILVSATINVDPPHDPDCSNIAGGPQVATWLTTDVRNLVESSFRTATARAAWGLMGYSEGGLCAQKLALQYPQDYAAAVSISGDDHPDGDLLKPGTAAYDQNAPLWLVQHRPPALPVSLLLAGTLQDGATAAEAKAMGAAARGAVSVDELISQRGGHNMGVWQSVEPAAFTWLSQRLEGPWSTSLTAAPELVRIPG